MTPAQRKAAIKKASNKARKEANQLDAQALNGLQQAYRQAAEEIRLRITLMAASDGTVRLDNLRLLRRQVDEVLEQLAQIKEKLLTGYQSQTAAVATGAFATTMPVAKLNDLAGEAVRMARAFQAADGLQLSDRLWRVNNHAREVVGRAIESAIIQGNSASQAAEDFIKRGAPVPAELQKKIKMADASSIGRATTADLMTGKGAPYNNARRLFRTEINRAHGMAYESSAFEEDSVVGTRFLLSPGHPEPDICDMHARVNKYGLGKGVYPQGKTPWPAHPNTLSYTEAVFDDEITSEDKAEKETRIQWLQKQPGQLQYQVLGSQKKAQALNAGLLKENHIERPWKDIKKYYEDDLL
ncbi:hypothetical protein [Endozoicomonas ascidiicola]|uniref:hypothetical protein n=1 Tax=Endozoicomonas ascidiicola TaxID=1698521 RepID=UPI00083216CD|nr:hypothetical protein [Endozoicomonas ascidiicola]